LLPFVHEALRDGGSSEPASTIIRAQVSDSAWRAEMHSALRTARLAGAVADARILIDSNDVQARAWVREKLADRTVWNDTTTDEEGSAPLHWLVEIAEQHPEASNPNALIDLLVAKPDAAHILDAIWAQKDGALEAQAGLRAAANPRAAIAWLGQAMNIGQRLESPAGMAAKKAAGVSVLKFYSSVPDSAISTNGSVYAMVDAIADAQEASAIPMLIGLTERTWYIGEPANEGLIRLTGAQPPRGTWYDAQPNIVAFWKSWWASNAATFTPVPAAQGLAALERWKKTL
jgi:hypothetical protein